MVNNSVIMFCKGCKNQFLSKNHKKKCVCGGRLKVKIENIHKNRCPIEKTPIWKADKRTFCTRDNCPSNGKCRAVHIMVAN